MRFGRRICDEDGVPICPRCLSAVTRFDKWCPHCDYLISGWSRFGNAMHPPSIHRVFDTSKHLPVSAAELRRFRIFCCVLISLGLVAVAGSISQLIEEVNRLNFAGMAVGLVLGIPGAIGLWRERNTVPKNEGLD